MRVSWVGDPAAGPPHDAGGFCHEALGVGDLILEGVRVVPGSLFQGKEAEANAQQCLDDFILQYEADFPPLGLLGGQHGVNELPQMVLQFA